VLPISADLGCDSSDDMVEARVLKAGRYGTYTKHISWTYRNSDKRRQEAAVSIYALRETVRKSSRMAAGSFHPHGSAGALQTDLIMKVTGALRMMNIW